MTRRRRRVLLAFLAIVLVGLALAQALRDASPPSLWIEAPDRVEAGTTFELLVSADEPASFRIAYGDEVVEAVDQDLRRSFEALPGEREARITAVDAAGNEREAVRTVEGVVVPRARLEAPAELRPGDAFTVALRFEPADAPRSDVSIRGGPAGDGTVARSDEAGAWVLGVVPLGSQPGTFTVEARWRDGLGRDGAASRAVRVLPLGQEVEQLRISSETLSVITPEGRALEEEALASARPDPLDPPRWTEPFLAPIEGRGTSGFGSPRRYVAGGPVSYHEGEDIAAPIGTPIRATNAGVVTLAGEYPIKGGLTIIDHGAGVTSRYFHQSAIHVEAGQPVARGEVIGEVGSTGLSTGPHLHWEMRVEDRPSWPTGWVDRTRP